MTPRAPAAHRTKSAESRRIRVALDGVGTVGRDFTRIAALSDDIEIVGACSRNPEYIGKGLAELAEREAQLPVVVASLEQAVAARPDVLIIATASHLAEVGDDIRLGVEAGCNVITTAEEAAYPWACDEELARELDARARAVSVTILGTGVNPGFAFDALVVTATGAAWDVSALEIERVLNIAGYSGPILRKLGIGFTSKEFQEGCASGAITGHIGFPQSMRVVARALGRTIEKIDRSISPLLSDVPLEVNDVAIAAGQSAGFTQRYVGFVDGKPWFTAHLVAHVAPAQAGLTLRDLIEISGSVPIRMVIEPGLNSQKTVAAVVANSLGRVVDAHPGWTTVADLPPARPGGHRRPQPQRQMARKAPT